MEQPEQPEQPEQQQPYSKDKDRDRAETYYSMPYFDKDNQIIDYWVTSKPDKYTAVQDLCMGVTEVECEIRGRVHRLRAQKKIIFLVLRQGMHTVQCVYVKKD